jgi:hypothetical protein
VIKGPAAATLYGTEVASGVIQIITKRSRTTKYDHRPGRHTVFPGCPPGSSPTTTSVRTRQLTFQDSRRSEARGLPLQERYIRSLQGSISGQQGAHLHAESLPTITTTAWTAGMS